MDLPQTPSELLCPRERPIFPALTAQKLCSSLCPYPAGLRDQSRFMCPPTPLATHLYPQRPALVPSVDFI